MQEIQNWVEPTKMQESCVGWNPGRKHGLDIGGNYIACARGLKLCSREGVVKGRVRLQTIKLYIQVIFSSNIPTGTVICASSRTWSDMTTGSGSGTSWAAGSGSRVTLFHERTLAGTVSSLLVG